MTKRGLTRDRLAEIAHEYVSDNGLDALTMRRLAAAAQVSPGALYKHVRDRKDLQRAMADTIFQATDLSDLDLDKPDGGQVITCCERIRAAMLRFRDGGRIVAGSYSPSAATVRVSGTLLKLLQAVAVPEFNAGEIALVLRSYTTGFVIEEQAYLELESTGEWDALVHSIASNGRARADESDDFIAIMTGNRDLRYTAGLHTVLSGRVDTVDQTERLPP